MRAVVIALVSVLLLGSAATLTAPANTTGTTPVTGMTTPSVVTPPTVTAITAFATTPEPGWVWPVEGERWVLRGFVAPPTRYGAGHRGVDLAAPEVGAAVSAATSGVVHFAGVVVDRPVITLRTGDLLVTVEPVEPTVMTGHTVRAGEPIGTLLAGHCVRPCVHLGVRRAGEYVSPLLFLGGLHRAVLLPLNR